MGLALSRAIMDLLRDAARRDPAAPALVEGDRRWTWGELDRDGDRLAAALRARGAGPGVTVATLLPSSADGVLGVLTVPRTGATLAVLNPRFTAAELGDALEVLDPALLVCDGASEALALAAAGPDRAGRVVRLDALTEGGAPVAGSVSRGVPPPEGAYALLWTSGTSGRPRGVAVGAEALAASARSAERRLGLGAGDRWYAALGLAHVGGLALVTRAAALGSCVVSSGRFDAGVLSRLVDDGGVTHVSLVPAMLRQVLDVRENRAIPQTLRCVLLGGAHTPRPLLDRALAAGVPVALTYGMTEVSSQAATAPPDLVRRKPGTVGEAIEGVRVGVAEDGEILLAGATLAMGYVGSDEPLLAGDGWLHTGDLGEKDSEGHLWVTGRRAERIVTGGVNVDPVEVEDVLRLHEGVEDVAVVGVEDEDWGEVVAAAIVRRPGAYPDPGELESLARARITTAKIPRQWTFVDAVPRNRNGKIERGAVRAMLEGGGTPGRA
ncbi:MAG: AMP-binding protein [Gemmatimonadetes bacterium]|nr:AMP-binding protein [Gemmatimonadota bacterium]